MALRVHLDTDLGGDMDDLCALAMLLRWDPPLEITGITVVGDDQGKRTGYVRRALEIAGRTDIPVAAGADQAGGYYPYSLGVPDDTRYWGSPVAPSPNPLDDALDLLRRSIERGAALIAIGPYTNLALLETRHPGILRHTELTLMGGYVFPTRPGYPQWDNAMDFNIQVDARSARQVLLAADSPSLIPLTVTVETALRRADLPRLREEGTLGALIARQAEAFAEDEQNETRIGATCPALPPDIINFQHDPLACAVALGWDGVRIETLRLAIEEKDGLLVERIDPAGKPFRVVTQVDGERFNQFWLDVVTG